MSRAARLRAWQSGRFAERAASWLLRLKGYRILACGWRHPLGEIDILARRGDLLVAVEVKRRDSRAAAAEAVLPRQRGRIARAAEAFLARQPDGARLSLRFDVILLAPRQWPKHIVDAWRP